MKESEGTLAAAAAVAVRSVVANREVATPHGSGVVAFVQATVGAIVALVERDSNSNDPYPWSGFEEGWVAVGHSFYSNNCLEGLHIQNTCQGRRRH